MLVMTWRPAAIVLAALSMAMAFRHLLETPPRLDWDAGLWIGTTVTGGVFRLFGTVGAAIETAAWASTAVLAWLVRDRGRPVFRLTAAAASLMILAFAAWWAFVYPVNVEMAGWTAQAAPDDWRAWRAQWEYAHAGRAVLLIAGFALLTLSVLIETEEDPTSAERRWGSANAPGGRRGSIARRMRSSA